MGLRVNAAPRRLAARVLKDLPILSGGKPAPRLVDDSELADRLERAYGDRIRILALDIPERETIIRALEDPPPGLEELRATLLAEHVGRVRDGLT